MMGLIAGGGYFFFKNYQIDGLSQLSVQSRDSAAPLTNALYEPEDDLSSSRSFTSVVANSDLARMITGDDSADESPLVDSLDSQTRLISGSGSDSSFSDRSGAGSQIRSVPRRRIGHGTYRNLKLGSWALDGFGPTKLANRDVRAYVAKITRRFDVMAVQQVASIERDLIPRLVDEINAGENRYEFLLGPSTGPRDRGEQLAFIFDSTRVEVDRGQTYTVDDPEHRFTFDPLVAWFRAREPDASEAWTFSMVNVRVDMPRASEEVAMLPGLMAAVADDGRGEDDVVLAGLMQADDAYLLPTFGNQTRVTVRHRSTDIYDRYQTANVILNIASTTEYLGRGGVFDFARHYRLGRAEAEAVTSHLPVYGEFTAHEGGQM